MSRKKEHLRTSGFILFSGFILGLILLTACNGPVPPSETIPSVRIIYLESMGTATATVEGISTDDDSRTLHVRPGTEVSLRITEVQDGYIFGGWVVQGGGAALGIKNDEPDTSFTMPDQSLTITASFSENLPVSRLIFRLDPGEPSFPYIPPADPPVLYGTIDVTVKNEYTTEVSDLRIITSDRIEVVDGSDSATSIAANDTMEFKIRPTTPINAGPPHSFSITVRYKLVGEEREVQITNTFEITRLPGVAVTAPAAATITSTSITVTAITAPANGQTVEYAIRPANEEDGSEPPPAPTTGWQDSPSFIGLIADTKYYVYARSKLHTNYQAGTASVSAVIQTAAAPILSVTVDGDNEQTAQGGYEPEKFGWTIKINNTGGPAEGLSYSVQGPFNSFDYNPTPMGSISDSPHQFTITPKGDLTADEYSLRISIRHGTTNVGEPIELIFEVK